MCAQSSTCREHSGTPASNSCCLHSCTVYNVCILAVHSCILCTGHSMHFCDVCTIVQLIFSCTGQKSACVMCTPVRTSALLCTGHSRHYCHDVCTLCTPVRRSYSAVPVMCPLVQFILSTGHRMLTCAQSYSVLVSCAPMCIMCTLVHRSHMHRS